MDKQLHVVKGKLLNIVPEMIFLIHSLKKSQGSGPDLGNKYNNKRDEEITRIQTSFAMNSH